MKNIVILGAGFGGLHAAMKLGRQAKRGKLKEHKIILIDKNGYHTYTPTLYEVSTTSKEVANYIDLKSVNTFPVQSLLNNRPVEFIEAEVVKIDIQKGDIHLADGRHIPYDHLIIALGAETNYFGIPGLKEHSLTLKSFADAVKIRDAVWETVEGAGPNDHLEIIIGGAGPTGVELAGEIQGWLTQLKKEGYNCKTNVKIVNATEEILPRFDKRIIRRAARRCRKLGIKVVANTKITAAKKDCVVLANGEEIPFGILIWAGGVKANSLTNIFPFKTEKQEQLKVDRKMLCVPNEPDLDVKGKIYAVGDITCVHNPKTGEQVAGVARVAISQGHVVAKNVARDIRGNPEHVTYQPMSYPYIVPIGGKYAIAKFGPVVVSGFLGWILKGLVELSYLFSIMPPVKALRIWFRGLAIFIQNDRLG